jgi:Phage portal protein, SPP1 Gp6-like.
VRHLRELLIDAWSWLNYKQAMAHPSSPGHHAFPELNNSWVPAEDLRRLAAYKFLTAYDSNQAGQLASVTGDDHHGVERRELGDPSKLIDTTLSYLLGAEQTIVVPGAERPDQAGEQPTPAAKAAADLQDKLRSWADKELLPLRIQQAERCAVRSGDGIYTLAWEPSKRRVLLRTYDPGWYFPEWEEGEQDAQEYPQRVHFAWELPADPVRGLKDRVRRITYELGPVGPATAPGQTSDGRAIREQVAGADGDPALTVGDTLDALTGTVTRTYPWAPGKPSSTTCYLTDAEWLLEDLGSAHDVFSLPANKAAYRVRSDGQVLDRLDLMVDFIPVVHVPNSIPDVGEHWGKPTLATVLQLMDELQATDTDSASASSTTGTPIVALAGARLPIDRSTGQPLPVRVEAGTVWQLSDNGRMDALDTSAQLAELRQRVDHLLDRLASNTRLTTAGLGTLDVAKVPSGYALQLALGPLDSLVGGMRLARDHKYQLLLRMVQRLHQAGQVWPAGESLPARLVWGAHTPTDRTTVLNDVTAGYAANVFSLETAVRMLQEAGYPIEDVAEEIERIQKRAFDQAARLADATGDNGVVRKYLGLPAADSIPTVPLAAPAAAAQSVTLGEDRNDQ